VLRSIDPGFGHMVTAHFTFGCEGRKYRPPPPLAGKANSPGGGLPANLRLMLRLGRPPGLIRQTINKARAISFSRRRKRKEIQQ
jgi:hypothetical protein